MCDIQKLRSEISSLKSDIHLLRIMVDDFFVMENQQLKKLQSILQQQTDYHFDNQIIAIFLYFYFIIQGHYPSCPLLFN